MDRGQSLIIPPLFNGTNYAYWKIRMRAMKGLRLSRIQSFCNVEFYQPSCWLYSVPNLPVFQQLVTLYLGGILVKVVSEIVCKKNRDSRLDLMGDLRLQAARS